MIHTVLIYIILACIMIHAAINDNSRTNFTSTHSLFLATAVTLFVVVVLIVVVAVAAVSSLYCPPSAALTSDS